MANDHVEIHDPFSNNNVASSDTEPTSQAASMDDTVEFRLLMAYSQRRRPRAAPSVRFSSPMDPPSPQKDGEVKTERKRKRKGMKRVFKMFNCIKPPIKNDEPSELAPTGSEPEFRCRTFTIDISDDVEKKDELDEAAGKISEIADEIPFTPPVIEMDSPREINDVEKVVALLLREAGDKLNEETKDLNLAAELFRNYSFYEKVIKTLLRRMGLVSTDPDRLGPQASPKAQIAVTCEATNRLLTLTSVPQRSMLGYGARYLQDYYSPWVTQNGGYVEIFHSDEEEEEDVE
ncbi:apoptosis facilitator Bcl-2-like protein 14 [Takifugu rubripes]|uniref:apoptosis facilitator Bcl-2-like protein 14 n=1 Tax=Takifugu rubripes TaxID=31033 RepID=UPI001145F73C|nr:apoptosis facilitator Bcl-2-like protein 14 [Takifugu rubripes]